MSDVVYRIETVEGESELEREVREKVGGELWRKWKSLQNSVEWSRNLDTIERWKAEQALVEKQLEALGWRRGDVWDDYNEEAPMRRAMEARAEARESELMVHYDEEYDFHAYYGDYPDDD